MTATITEERLQTTDIPAQAAHIVMVPPDQDDETPQAYVLRARIEGFPITALCGHVFTPERDPKPLPVCQTCLDIYQQPGDQRDSRDQLPEA